MSSAIGSVIVASAQSVGKVYVIGAVGVLAVTFPRKAPLLPAHAVGTVARFSFHVLILPLIYGTIAKTVSASTIGSLWFVIVGAISVIGISYMTATILGRLIKIKNPIDFDSLRISASFPNIVALPILIFPSLCEYPVVYNAFGIGETTDELQQTCVDQSTTMIFCYFFAWSFLFYSVGQNTLMAAANKRIVVEAQMQTSPQTIIDPEEDPDVTDQQQEQDEKTSGNEQQSTNDEAQQSKYHVLLLKSLLQALKDTSTSPGFLAMLLGFITASIPPLQHALFSSAGALRFVGAALETLGTASSSISTMVVAASLVPYKIVAEESSTNTTSPESMDHFNQDEQPEPTEEATTSSPQPLESSIMSDPNFGPRLRIDRLLSIRNESLMVIRRRSSLFLDRITRSDRDMWRLHLWFILSRLVISPAIVTGVLVGLDCGGILTSVPPLGKLVLVINAALPGALIVVVLLKSQPALSESAAIVAKVYLPSYLISIITIAAWASVGLYISVPNDDGTSFCGK